MAKNRPGKRERDDQRKSDQGGSKQA